MVKSLIIAMGLIFCLVGVVQAQTPTETPTATPTPAYLQDIPLPSGNVLHVERTISYGDAAITIMLLVLFITLVLGLIVVIPKMWLGGR